MLAPDQGIRVGVNGVAIRRHVKAGAIAAEMVMVHKGLRPPIPKQDGRHILRLDQVGLKGVAVVVVARVFVIQPGQIATFVFGVQPTIMPIGHHDLAVGVETRN